MAKDGAMPSTKEGPTPNDFYRLRGRLFERKFQVISPQDVNQTRYRYGIESVTLDLGRETGFKFSHNGYTVKVWPSFVEATQEYKVHDYGFVLIVRDRDNYVAYWGRLIRRTKNFGDNVFDLADKCRQVVLGVVPCPDPRCRQLMHIVPGRRGKGKMYACLNDALHGYAKGPTMSIDYNLDEKTKDYAIRHRKARKRDNADKRRKTPRASGFGNRRARHKSTFTPADA